MGKSRKSAIKIPLPQSLILSMYNNGQILQGHSHLIRQLQSLRHHSTITSKDSTQNIPHLPTEHKPISSWPSHTSFSIDQLRKSFGFRNIDTILPHIQKTSLPNYSISTKDREKILDLGETATISTSKSNKDSIPLPHSFGDVIHIDILYGTVTAHEGVRYSLFIVDRATRHRFILPMSNLKTDLLTTMNKLRKFFGSTPRRILTDFDHKLMGQSVLDNFTDDDGFCIIESAPPDKQNQNGLSESNWKSILYMARAWLTSNLLPSQYWWWAMKRATEISNYLPIKIDNKYTTPYELVYNNKPDLRFLIPQFSIAYISRYRDGNIERKNTHSQSIRAILVGRDPVSAAYLFYHPGTQKTLTSTDFTIDDTLPSGPAFHLQYDGGFYFNRYADLNDKLRPPTYKPNQQVFIDTYSPPLQGTVIAVPASPIDRIYTIQLQDHSIHQILEDHISTSDPNKTIENNNPPLSTFPNWIKHNCKATIFLHDMEKPIKGHLISENNEWYLLHGSKTKPSKYFLPDFTSTAFNLYTTHSLFNGHPHNKTIINLRGASLLSQIIAKHISARNLTSEEVPTLLKHHLLNDNDKTIWDNAYNEEYDGLYDLPCWYTITQKKSIFLNTIRSFFLLWLLLPLNMTKMVVLKEQNIVLLL